MYKFICLVLLFSSFAQAQENQNKISDLLVKMHFRVRAERSDLTDFSTHRSSFYLRARPEFIWTPDPEVSIVFQPQATKAFGEPYFVGTSTTANTRQESSGQAYDSTIGIHQAYADYHPSDYFKLLVGRQILSYGDELVIGALEWNNVGRSFDAFKTKFTYGLGFTDFFISKLQDTNITSSGAGDKDFYGLYNSWNLNSVFQSFDFYALMLNDLTISPQSHLWTFGLRVKSQHESLDYRAEVTKQIRATHGFQVDGEVGFTFENTYKPRVGIEYFYASADYQQLFPTTHKWLGYADVFGRRNIQGGVLHLGASLNEKLSTTLDYHYLRRLDSRNAVYKTNGSALGTASGSTSNALGSEIDLTFKHQTTKSMSLSGGVAWLFSGKYFKDQFGDKTPGFYYLQMDIKI